MARLSAGVRGWMPLAIYESAFLSPENGPPLVGETVGSRRQWWTFHSRHRSGGLQVRGIDSRGGGSRTVAASEASEYVAADFHGNRLIRKDGSWLGAVEVRVVPIKRALPDDSQILAVLEKVQQPVPSSREVASKAVAQTLGVSVRRVRRLYAGLDEKYKARRGRKSGT